MELTYSDDAQFGFLEEDDEVLQLDPLQPGERAFYITSPDGDGIGIIGKGGLRDIRELVRLMLRGLDEEIDKENQPKCKDCLAPLPANSDEEYLERCAKCLKDNEDWS